MRPIATACLLAWSAAACTPEPPLPRDGGPAFLPDRYADLAGGVGIALPDGLSPASRSPGPPEADGGPATPSVGVLPLLSADAILADGSATPLARDGSATAVEPSARFRLEVGARLPDARLSLLDGQDALVPAEAALEAAATTRFMLAPAAPLRPGSSYALRLEGAEGRLLVAEDGQSYEPLTLVLRTSGTAPVPQRKAKRSRRSR